MSKQFAIYHTEKGKGSGGGLGNHIDRVPGKEHTYKNANPKLLKVNKDFTPEKYKGLSIPQGVKKRIAEGYNGKRKIRTDAVKFLTHIFSGSHDQMHKILRDEKAFQGWLQKTFEFAKKEFGRENTIKVALHLDEKTPHLHIVTVPLTSDGRLSAREIMGNKKDMQRRQDQYAELMKEFGLERGVPGTGIKRETAQDYNRRLKLAELELDKLKVRNPDNSINQVETLLNMGKTIKAFQMEILDPQRDLKNERDRRGGLSPG